MIPLPFQMPPLTHLTPGLPILDSINLRRSVRFYAEALGFTKVYLWPERSAVVQRGDAMIHFWACPPDCSGANTFCRIHVSNVDALYEEYLGRGFLKLQTSVDCKPWGTREFKLADIDDNVITFFQWLEKPLAAARRTQAKIREVQRSAVSGRAC